MEGGYYKNVTLFRSYYENGQIENEAYCEGTRRRIGTEKLWYENGKLKGEWYVVNGKIPGMGDEIYKDGQFRRYYNVNGNIQREYYTINNKMIGPDKAYYKNGKLRYETYNNNGLRDGKSTSYYEDGQIQQIIIFKNGKALKIIDYDRKGSL
jgi:antitoxin component YwqK of YwqJK toxin-antitoxin module